MEGAELGHTLVDMDEDHSDEESESDEDDETEEYDEEEYDDDRDDYNLSATQKVITSINWTQNDVQQLQ